MNLLNTLSFSCFGDDKARAEQLATQQMTVWERWLLPITPEQPTGEDPSYDDDFERMREEVNKLSGSDTELVCELAEKLLTGVCKDVRVVTYYIWARLHKEGEAGFADALGLFAGLLARFGDGLLPSRKNSRKSAIEWLAGNRVLDSLSLYPEVGQAEFERIIALLMFIQSETDKWDETLRPALTSLYSGLEKRLAQSGGPSTLVPQNMRSESSRGAKNSAPSAHQSGLNASISPIQSGRELLDQAKALANYLRDQPDGWLAGHRLMKTVRWDTLHQLPPQNNQGCTRLTAPRTDARAQLKRLYMQQNWGELLEQADRIFTEGVNHFWLDVQWYLYQALSKSSSPWDGWAAIIKSDLQQFLTRLPGVENLAWEDGSPFADEVTLGWIRQHVLDEGADPLGGSLSQPANSHSDDDNILLLEQEALAQADTEGIEKAIAWLQHRPEASTPRQQWLLRLLMARIADQFGRHEMALYLLRELDKSAQDLTLQDWEPHYVFEIKARQLQLLRSKAQRNTADKTQLQQQMEQLLAELTHLDPVRSVVLYA
nr:type VI secretion system protein TssA [uncultured Moellerella sp.]